MPDSSETDFTLSSLESVTQGASLYIIGRVAKQLIDFVTSLVLTRSLGTSLYGVYAYLSVVFTVFRVFTRLGGNTSMLRYLPEYEDDPRMQNAMLTLAYLTSLVASVIVAVVVYVSAPLISSATLDQPIFVEVLRIGAIVIPFNTLAKISYATFRAIERMEYNILVSSILDPIFRLVFVGGGVVLGYSVIGATAGLVVAGFLSLVSALYIIYSRTELGSFDFPRKTVMKEYYNYSVPLTFNQIGSFLYNRLDILMVGFLLSGSAVGIYNISVMLAGVIAIPLAAFSQIFPPIASKLYHNEETSELTDVYRTVTRWIFTVSLFPGIAVMVYAEEILSLFGEGFTDGVLVLILFTIAQLTNSAVGPSGFLLMMTDHQYLTMTNQVVSGTLNAVLNYVFILEYGFIGAAVATASVLTVINMVRVIQLWYLEGVHPYNRKYIKPITAGVVAVSAMYLVSTVLGGYPLLLIGGIAGATSFGVTLYIIGFEQEEVDILKRMIESR
jgi:O-antigen/teichoic acid export membrane protein